MENQIIGVSELSENEKVNLGGGSFAHDLGTALRFTYNLLKYGASTAGVIVATTDYAANKVKCGCE